MALAKFTEVSNGVTFFNIAGADGPHTDEILFSEEIEGIMFFMRGGGEIPGDLPAYVISCCKGIWAYSPLGQGFLSSGARFVENMEDDDRRKIEEIKKPVEDEKIIYIGLSKVCASTIRKVHAVCPITAVQIKRSLWSRDVEEEIISTCRELGIGFVAFNPLRQGFVSSEEKHVQDLEDYDWRKNVPSFFRKVGMYCLDLVCYGRLLPTLLCMALIGIMRASSTKKSLALIALLILLMAMDASAGYNNTNMSDSYSGSHGNSGRYTPNPPNPQP